MLQIQGLMVQRGSGNTAYRVLLPELNLQRGEIIAVTGESGCGKSTLLESLALLLRPQQVEKFLLDGEDICPYLLVGKQTHTLASIRSRQLGFVLQNGGLLPYLSVENNILLPRKLLGMPHHSKVVDYLIDQLKLRHLLTRLPAALSIGERQRVACVRALAHEPKLVLADEPTSALDPINARKLFELLLAAVNKLDLAVVIVSHDWKLLDEFSLPSIKARIENQGATFE